MLTAIIKKPSAAVHRKVKAQAVEASRLSGQFGTPCSAEIRIPVDPDRHGLPGAADLQRSGAPFPLRQLRLFHA